MELGNLVFGHSRGERPVPRGRGWEEELYRLFNAYAPERDNSWREYGEAFENETFRVFPYYWGDCTCGYEQAEWEWSEAHKHAPDCYQSQYHEAMTAWERESGYARLNDASAFVGHVDHPEPGITVMHSTPAPDQVQCRALYEQRQAYQDRLWQSLCAKFNIPWNDGAGAAIHCTCTYGTEWNEWAATHDHVETCPIVIPNFRHKPTDLRLSWYKYPLRDAYMNQRLTLPKFRKVIDACVASVKP